MAGPAVGVFVAALVALAFDRAHRTNAPAGADAMAVAARCLAQLGRARTP